MKISIIVPVYNSQLYIEKCISSLLNQTYKNIELLIIDDGSTDNSTSIIKKLKKQDGRIKLIRQKNLGANIARGRGIKNASGEYCMFVDSDDWIELDTVEKLVRYLESGEYDIIKYNGITEPNKKLKNFYLTENDENLKMDKNKIYNLLLTTNILNNMCFTIYKTDIIKNVKTFNYSMSNCEDYLANLEIYSSAKDILFVKDIFYHYRENLQSTTKTKSKDIILKNINDFDYTFSKLFEYIDLWKINDKKIINKTAFRIIDMTRASLFNLFKCDDLNKEEFISTIRKVANNDAFKYIYENVTLKELKIELKRMNFKYKIKNYFNIINLYKKKFNLLWLNLYLYKLKNN